MTETEYNQAKETLVEVRKELGRSDLSPEDRSKLRRYESQLEGVLSGNTDSEPQTDSLQMLLRAATKTASSNGPERQ